MYTLGHVGQADDGGPQVTLGDSMKPSVLELQGMSSTNNVCELNSGR